MRKLLFIFMLALVSVGMLLGQFSIAQTSVTYSQNFDTLANTGTGITWTNGTTLSGWYARTDATETISAYSTNTGTTTAGALYSFGTASDTDRAFGYAASNTFFGATGVGKGYIGWRLVNNTGSTITSLTVTWTGEQWRKENNAVAHNLSLFYQTGATVSSLIDGTWISANSIFTSPIIGATTATALDGNLEANRVVNITANITGISIPNGQEIMLRWEDLNDSGNDHQLAIDDVSFIASSGAPTPTINVVGTLNAFSTTTGTPSASQSYTLSGVALTGNINVAALAGYAYSTDNTNWSSSLSLANTYNGLVYVRLTGATAGTFNGNIVHSSTGASDVNLAATGTVTNPVPTINVSGTLNAFSTIVGTPSASQSYTVSGSFLTANIIVTPPTGYELSTDNSTFSPTLSLANTFNGLVYVRLSGTTAGEFNGNITHTSTGATQVDKAVSGTVNDPAVPTTLFEENFEYVAGTTLTSNGWTAHSGSGIQPIIVASEGLVYPGYFASSGLAAQTVFAGSAEDVHKTFASQTAGSVYAAFLINTTNVNTTGDYIVHFGPSTIGTDFKGRLFVKRDADNNLAFGVSKASSTGAYTAFTYAYNTTYLIVLKYVINSGLTNDEVYMWVNPTIGAVEPAYTLAATDVIGTDVANVGAIAIRQGSNSPIARIDGIKVTTDWAQLWSGEAPPTPVIHVSTNELDPLACIINSPSDEIRSYTLYGENISGGITVTAPEGFQVSTTGVDGWNSFVVAPAAFNGLIYVRMFASADGDYDGNIVHTSPGAVPVNVAVNGTCFLPDVTWNIPANLPAFSGQAGTPTAAQSYNLSATGASSNLVVTTTAPFELSTTGTGGWTNELSFAYNYNSLVYVRMNATGAGTFNATINHNTTNATEGQIAISGTATPAPGMAADLFFSEYIEGSSNNKAIEIFNGTGGPVDLSNYTIKLGSNGGVWSNTLTPTGTLAHGDVYVIANASANAAILAVADVTSNVTFFNGDDALGLFHGETQIDAFGIYPSTQGVFWAVAGVAGASAEHTLIRKPTVTQGNLDWAASAGTDADNSEWIVYPQNYVDNLGTHLMGNYASTPTFDPPAGAYANAINVTISCSTPGAVIRYTTNGTEPNESSTQYLNPIPINSDTTLKARAYATGFDPSAIATAVYDFPQNVSTIAQLRAGTPGTNYKLTGVGILTFKQTFRGQKYIQDATGGILIDDLNGIITTNYNLYDGISNIVGTVAEFGGMMQLTPIADPGAAVSSGNVVNPQAITLNELVTNFENYESELVKITGVTFDTADGTIAFANGTMYPMNTGLMNFRTTFYDVDYIGTVVPTSSVDIVGIPNSRVTEGNLFTARFLSDFSPAAGFLLPPDGVMISQAGGTVTVSWNAVAGATSYRIESCDDPYGTFTTVTTTTNLFWSGATNGKKFYRVIALN